MALSVTVLDRWSDGKRVHVVGRITASANYVALGDTVDLKAVARTSKPPVLFKAEGRAGYNYVYVAGTTIANGKLRVLVPGSAAAADLQHTHDLFVTGGALAGDAILADAGVVSKAAAGDVTLAGSAANNILNGGPAAAVDVSLPAELAAAPYPAMVTGDVILFYAIFKKV